MSDEDLQPPTDGDSIPEGDLFAPPDGEWKRVIDRYTGEREGPKLLCIAGLHGNEPAGIIALHRVFQTLKARNTPFCGELVAFTGNLAALHSGARYLERDMNRMWTEALVERALAPPQTGRAAPGPGSGHVAEWREVSELWHCLHEELDEVQQEVYLLDLHTSSADGVPFACIGDTLRNRRFARPFPVPMMLGLEEQLDGALLEYLNDRGVITMGFEAGQHRSPLTIARHEAAIWIGLNAAGCFPGPVPEQVESGRRLLADARGGLPKVLEILHRHALRPADGFSMHPGYENFTPVEQDEIVAQDRGGLIRSPSKGRMMLPLYQGKGDDGFFIARRVSRNWLRLSALLRSAGLEAILPLLPGVKRHPSQRGTLLVNQRVARWYSLQIFHLLGFRKRRQQGDLLVVSRRRFDRKQPETLRFTSKTS